MTVLKSIVACLVLANMGYFLWSRGIARTEQAPAQLSPAPTLKLASESGEASRTRDAVAGSVVAGSGGTTGGSGVETRRADPAEGAGPSLLINVRRCISVGPFRDVSEAAHAAATLRGGGYDPRQRVADGDVWAGVWIYLPLPPSRAAGEQMLAKLKAAGIEDALEMPGPTDGSVFSLGLYSESKRAQARVAQVQGLGFNPGIADRKRNGNVYWIDIDLKPTDSSFNPADLQGEAGHIVRLEVKSCPSNPSGSP